MINHHNFIKKEPVISFFTKKKKYKPVFSILIPTWNNLDFLKLCINSLKKILAINIKLFFTSMKVMMELWLGQRKMDLIFHIQKKI